MGKITKEDWPRKAKIRVGYRLLENLLNLDNLCEEPGSHGLGCTHSRLEVVHADQPVGYLAVDLVVTGDKLEPVKFGDVMPRYEVTVHNTRPWIGMRKE